ncbi:MAG: MurR/RpiR family transcriptional regulator [Rhodanobacteraceae bacterium]
MIKDLQQRLNRHQGRLTPSERRIATYLLHNLEGIPFETAASLGNQTGVSPMTVSRFLRTIGYRGLAELKNELRDEAPWLKLYRTPPTKGGDTLAQRLEGEVQALASVYELARHKPWREVVKRVAHADRVTVASFPFVRFLGLAWADLLRHVRSNVTSADGSDGAYADLLLDSTRDSCVVLIDMRRYSKPFRVLAEEVAARGIPMVIVCDSSCYWANDLTPLTLMLPAKQERTWHNISALMTLFSLLLDSVITELGDVYPRIEDIGELRGRFTGYEKVGRKRDHRPPSRHRR